MAVCRRVGWPRLTVADEQSGFADPTKFIVSVKRFYVHDDRVNRHELAQHVMAKAVRGSVTQWLIICFFLFTRTQVGRVLKHHCAARQPMHHRADMRRGRCAARPLRVRGHE